MYIKDRISKSVTGVKAMMEQMNADVPLHYTEWGSCTGLFDIIQDMEFTAPFILKVLKQVQGKVDSFSYWTHSDIFEEQGIPKRPFGNGFGLININGLWKASFNVFVMLKMMNDKEIVTDCESAFITTSEDENKIQILMWNYEPIKEIEEYDKFIYDETLCENFEIVFKNIEGNYKFEKYQIDKYHSNVYQKWVDLGESQYPTKQQINILKNSMKLEKLETKNINLKENTSINVNIPKCGVTLITLEK